MYIISFDTKSQRSLESRKNLRSTTQLEVIRSTIMIPTDLHLWWIDHFQVFTHSKSKSYLVAYIDLCLVSFSINDLTYLVTRTEKSRLLKYNLSRPSSQNLWLYSCNLDFFKDTLKTLFGLNIKRQTAGLPLSLS